MKIIVLNGSPKGEISVTMQYVAYIQKEFPQHEFKILHITQQMNKLESDNQFWNKTMEDIKSAAGIVWAFPLYVFLVHGNYKRFIELIFEREAQANFLGKHTAIVTTSIHFYDHTAHNYIQGICDDLHMMFYATFSAEMQDLFKEKERVKLVQFSQHFFAGINRNIPASQVFPPLIPPNLDYSPGSNSVPLNVCGQKVVVLTDAEPQQTNLKGMIEKITASFGSRIEVVNLHDIDIKGGCLGCIRCGYDNTCIYQDKDGFSAVYNDKLKNADILIFAGTIKDRYLSSLWKTFFDRAFFNTHKPSFAGKQIAFLVSGPLKQLANLRQIFEAYTEWQQANLVGIVTDEAEDSEQLDARITELALRSMDYASCRYVKPPTFLGVGAIKVFRDEIWGALRFPFIADHQYYKSNGLYDFPHHDYATRLRNGILGWLVKVPAIRKKIYSSVLIHKMVEPYRKLLDHTRNK
jgi:multimeric flavodoxin WrbA